MPNLHVHYHNGNIKAFRQELDNNNNNNAGGGGGNWKNNANNNPGSASGGKSWSMSGFNIIPVKTDVNERDQFGRTYVCLSPLCTHQDSTSIVRGPFGSVSQS